MRDNPSLTTWLLLGGGAFAAYHFYLRPRMAAHAAAQTPPGAPVKRDWVAELFGVVTSGAETYWQKKRAEESNKKIRNILEGKGKAQPPKRRPIDPSILDSIFG